MPRPTLAERFWKGVPHREPDACWLWEKSKNWRGYGQIGVARATYRLAHRVAYELHHGVTLTREQHVLHSCDRPSCVNPSHLRVGTHAENMRDMAERGRAASRPGEQNGGSRLTEAQVREIRESALSQRAAARLYGVSQATIHDVVSRKSWAHL